MRAESVTGKHQIHFVAVQTENDRGHWTNLTNLRGRDWVESVTWGESIDSPVGYASVTLRKAIEGDSISPFVREDLFGPGRRIRISVAVGQPNPADPGSVAQNLKWIPGFLGKIDDIEVVRDTIQIRARDMGAYIQDAVFEYDRVYGEAGGIPADVVMQNMLDDVFGIGAIRLRVQHYPNLFVEPDYDDDGVPRPNVRRGTSVLQAIRDLAMQAGLDVRYRWTNQGYELTLYKPPRVLSASTVHVAFGPDQWAEAPTLSIGDSEIRNVIEVAWIDPELQYERSVKVYNDESMRRFLARRYLLLSGEATRYITNAEQAAKMAEAALADLSFPAATRAVRVLLCPGIELGDTVALHGNGTDIAATATGAVTAYEHNFSTGTGWTTIWLRDAPAGARVEWLRRGTSGGTVPILPSSIR